jgi:hypothetical protein
VVVGFAGTMHFADTNTVGESGKFFAGVGFDGLPALLALGSGCKHNLFSFPECFSLHLPAEHKHLRAGFDIRGLARVLYTAFASQRTAFHKVQWVNR